VDWQDAARVSLTGTPDAETAARTCFDGAPFLLRLFLTTGWRLLLLEGGPRSDAAHVLGWPLVSCTPDMAVLRRRSRLGITATLVFTSVEETLTFASAMSFDHRFARVVWAAVAPLHRLVVRIVLGQAQTRLP
jgi:hypothetical protein